LRRRTGSRCPALGLTDLVYADDIVLLAPSFKVAQWMLDAVARECRPLGLLINVKKTKFMVRGDLRATDGELRVDGERIEAVDDFKYLGSFIGSVDKDIEARCNAASRAFGRLMNVWKGPLEMETKLEVFKTVVQPILFYACETWPLTARRQSKLVGHWFAMVRKITRRRYPYVRQSNASLIDEFKLKHPAQFLRERFLKHYGHALRTLSRETCAGVKLSPLSTVVAWNGGTLAQKKESWRRIAETISMY
jgi:hypothetical protein